MKTRRIILLLILMTFSNLNFAQKKSYMELVFPPDFHNYDLLFISHILSVDRDLSKQNDLIRDFIAKDVTRQHDHKLITQSESVEYSNEKYKYLIRPDFVELYDYNAGKSREVVVYYFYDRINNRRYRVFAYPNAMSEEDYDPTYSSQLLIIQSTKQFLKKMLEIKKSLAMYGPDKTFADEMEKQFKTEEQYQTRLVALVGAAIVIPLIIAIIING